MDRMRIAIEQEHPDGDALFIQVRINGDDVPACLDIEAFFTLKEASGLVPLFTCGCGVFGCGGYYVGVSCTDEALILRNSYHRGNRSLQAAFEYHLDWQQVSGIAQEIYSYLQKMHERNSQAYVTLGYGGENLLDRLPAYLQSPLLMPITQP
jgi:hypothetical protein